MLNLKKIFGGYYLYSNGILATLVPSVFATPIQNILSNPQSYIGKTVTVYGSLGDGNLLENGWYGLYTPIASIEVHINNPVYSLEYAQNYTMSGIVSKTVVCDSAYVVYLRTCNLVYGTSFIGGTNITIYYINVTRVSSG